MRYKFIILFLLIGFVSKAQVYQLMPQYGYTTFRMNFDSTIQIPTFCGVPRLGSNLTKKGALAFDSCNNRFYFYNPKSQAWDTIKSGSTIDTTKFVRYTDTAQFLLPYLRKIDTTNKWVSSVTKLNDSTIQVIKGTTTSNITISSVSSATRLITRVWNNTGATILRGSVVYISGRHSSNLPTIALAIGNSEANSYKTFALVDGDINDNSAGVVIQAGNISNLNLPTSSYTDGDILYLSPTVPGGYTTTKPLAPYHICKLGSVTRAHPTQGSIEIKIENGWQLDELSDVQIAAVPADSTLLQFSRVDSLWHDVSPLTAIGNRYLKPTDSVSLSNRINLKLNISDTASMLAPYARTNSITTGWGLLGNSGTSDATNFIGTTDNQDLIFRRNNVISGRIDSTSANEGITTYGFRTTSTATNTTSFGYKALQSATGVNNTAVGTLAGRLITNGANNTAVGNGALANAISGGSNTAFGHSSLLSTTGDFNTGIGRDALSANSSGNNNIGIGNFAGLYNTSASNQVFINSLNRTNYSGDQTGSPFYAQQNSTVTSQIVTLNGRVGINTISPNTSSALDITSTTRGFLQPRVTTTEMNAISTPATGLSVFNTTDSLEYVYRGTGSGWQKNVTYTRTNDIGLLNGADQRLMIEPTTNIVAGRALTVEAGSTQAGGTSAFAALSQTTRRWIGMAAAPNADIYVAVPNNDIYKRTGGIGNFTALSQGARVWQAMSAASNGDIYATVLGGDIYKQTGGTGNFIALSQTSRNWTGIAVAPNGDIYATVLNGDIYKSVGGGTFTALGQTSRQWYGIAVASNGDIYAAVFNGDIWRSTNGGTTFTALSQTSRAWQGLASSSSEIFAVVSNGDIYKQTSGIGNFTALGQTSRNWAGITSASNGDVYASVDNGDIYIQTAGTANLNGGTLLLQSGVGKGTGTSTINFNTGTTLTSGATLQSASTKMTILGNGNVGIGTTSPSAKLELSDTARGFLQTRMTTTQRNNISSPSVGLQVFTTTDSSQYVYRGTGAGWQQIANEIVNTASLNFPSTNAQNSSDLTITLTGAVDGDAVVLGVPNAAVNANSCYTAWVSASGVVTVRFNNYSSGAIDPASATFRVTIIK